MSASPRLLFCSYYCCVDYASGAAQSTRELLELCAAHGWPCFVLSGPETEAAQLLPLEAVLRDLQLPFQFRAGFVQESPCTLYHGLLNGVDVHGYIPTNFRQNTPPTPAEGEAFLSMFDAVVQRCRPDILLTYGGQWLVQTLLQRAKQHGLRTVFLLHNLEYHGAALFREVDAVLVPSEASQRHYREKLGLTSTALPGPWDWSRILCSRRRDQFVTFVNPQPAKGGFWFARILLELSRRRPDIPFLVVEARGTCAQLADSGLDLAALPFQRMANTREPREFYEVTRLLLVPSVWNEAFGRVAVEAMINGIPVLASRRGGLPEALGGAGFLFDMPESHPPAGPYRTPSAAEVALWLAIIERLWDDEAFYQAESARCRDAAEAWRPERLWPRFEAFFRGVMRR
jgi:glycosyltransferase involved in cell wall biosynthesis